VKEQNVQWPRPHWRPAVEAGHEPVPIHDECRGRLTDPSQFSNTVINVGLDGRITQFKDIGHAELAAADYSTAMTYDGKPPSPSRYSAARRQFNPDCQCHLRAPQGAAPAVPARHRLRHPFRYDHIRPRQHARCREDPPGGRCARAIVVMIFLQNWRAALVRCCDTRLARGHLRVMYVHIFR